MNKIGPDVFVPPMPVALVGALVNGRANFMAVGWLTRVNYQPPMLAVALNKMHHTPKGIAAKGTFSACFPSVSMKEVTDYCGVVSGRDADKSQLFEVFYGETETAPMIAECPLNIECRLVQMVELPSNVIYIGEMVAAYCEERFLTDGQPDIRKMDPLLLTMPDNRYWRAGEMVGMAFIDGLNHKVKDLD
jgi:flavin reductase (DIM6/NTAB) family NADH-FMN oxidoreductase RutF